LTAVTKIILEPFLRTSTSHPDAPAQRYRVWYDGSILIEDTHNPEYEACRALLRKGVTGRLETFRSDKSDPCMILDIEMAAGLTISETTTLEPRVVPWKACSAVTVGV
jgi:hypothetical protein